MIRRFLQRQTSLSSDFLLFSVVIFTFVILLSMGFWLQVYYEEVQQKREDLAAEATRINLVLSDSIASISQYASFIGEKIAQHNDPYDLDYIASLINSNYRIRPQEQNLYFTTTFDWVTPEKQLLVSSKSDILNKPFDMSDRDYLERTPLYPWALQLSEPRIGGLSGRWILPAGMGITSKDGKFLGSITLGFALSGLDNRISQSLASTDVQYLVLTDTMKPALNSSRNNATGPDPEFSLTNAEYNRIVRAESRYMETPILYNGVEYVYAQKLPGYPYITLVGYSKDMPAALFNRIVLSRGIGLFGICLAAFLMLYLMRRRLIQPVMRLAAKANHIRKGEEVARINNPIDEINQLDEALQDVAEYVRREHLANEELNKKTGQLEIANAEACAARDAAIKADRSKSEFLANVSHELRTPMNAVIGLTNILLMQRCEPEQQEKYLKTMRNSANQLMQLINDLLDIAKLESGQLQLENIPFELDTLIREVVDINAVKAKEKGIELSIHSPGTWDTQLIGDPLRLRQILMNLIGNAVKFTEIGQVTVGWKGERNTTAQSMDVSISITDTGIGIPADKLNSIFEKFSQADASTTREFGGTGLGLSISKNFVELMGGSIAAQSNGMQGSCFTLAFSFPIAEEGAPEESSHTIAFPVEPSHKAFHILIVEDNKENILVVTIMLGALGYRYSCASNGQEALSRLEAGERFDLILSDVQMPKMNGFELVRRIREYEKSKGINRVPIIGMTAHVMKEDKEKCLEAGMDDYLAKPFNPDKFAQILSVYLGKARRSPRKSAKS